MDQEESTAGRFIDFQHSPQPVQTSAKQEASASEGKFTTEGNLYLSVYLFTEYKSTAEN